jgi:hypothetical protein
MRLAIGRTTTFADVLAGVTADDRGAVTGGIRGAW